MSHSSPPLDGYSAPAVIRAFDLLKVIADSGKPLSLSELARILDCSKSTMHGLLKALLQVKAVSRTGKNYVLGPALAALTLKGWNIIKLSERTKPILSTLRDATEETVFLGIMGVSKSTILAIREATKPLKISAPAGTEIPLQAGAVGKVFLSLMEPGDVDRFLETYGLPAFTSRSITEPPAYLKELEQVRKNGYALDIEEYLPGVNAVAVAVGNQKGLPMVVWVAGFASSLVEEAMERHLPLIQETARAIRQIIDQDNSAR